MSGDGGDVIPNAIQISTSTDDIHPNNNNDDDASHIVSDMCEYPTSLKA